MKTLLLFFLAMVVGVSAPFATPSIAVTTDSPDSSYFGALDYRCIGPFRGGRSAAVAGVPGNPMLYYFGAAGGGLWRTQDGGQTWGNISDGYFGGSIGAVAVSEWDPNVIYVGGGEVTVRGNVSHGYGMFRSEDAGKTWKSIGLKDSRRIPRIRIHPRDPDMVYAAVLGHLYGPNEERGVYRSKDGGKTWDRILFVNNEVGAVDLAMDPTNPRILFASMWRIKRTPYSLESGGQGCGLWKSTDGGDTWTDITKNDGLPEGLWGISGVTVSPANPERVWAIIENDKGGVYRSDNGGETWSQVNDERKLRQRAWYYSRIYADPVNEDQVYVLNVRFWRSKDGGKTYESIRTPHVDHHDLWIAPEDPLRMIVGDDGGGQCSVNGGESWSLYTNQPTAQFYRVTVDNVFPYRIYGAQQDNSTVRIAHRSGGGFIGERDWEPTAGGESGHIAPYPEDPDIVYGGSYGGFLTMYNHRTEEVRAVNVWPDNPMGMGAGELKYRFQWNFPIFFSPHDSNVLYTAGNVMFKTTNGGQSWDPISPDLTRNDPSTLGSSGGPITKDNTSVEYYATIFAAEESPHEKGVIWAGSDDGLLHITRDGGENWTNVTPSGMPEWMQINSIEIHPTEPGGLYVAGTRYKSDDFAPYLYKTTNYGSSWKKITRGIDPTHFTRVIRADPERAGLLYAGTESGLYISLDDGESWRPFQRNLPIVPITDLAVTNRDLVVATQGRSFWVMDDLSTVHQLSDAVLASKFHLFTPRPTYRMGGGGGRTSMTQGTNPRNGVYIDYHLSQAPKDSSKVVLRVLEENGDVIKSFTHKEDQLPLEVGSNRFVWNMRYEDAERFDGIILWGGGLQGPKAVPGFYKARLVMEDDSLEVPFEIKIDPRIQATELDLQATFDFQMEVRDKLTEVHKTIKAIRSVRDQINTVNKGVDPEHAMKDSLESVAKDVLKEMKEVEEALYQTKNQSNQDPLNYPIRLNNRLSFLSSLSGYGDFSPTDQTIAVQEEVTKLIDEQLRAWRSIRDSKIPEFNDLVKEAAIPAVVLQP